MKNEHAIGNEIEGKKDFDYINIEPHELNNLNLYQLINIIEDIAEIEYDGHFTILKFTTGYKVGFNTPDIRTGLDQEKINNMRYFDTLKPALIDLIIQRHDFYELK